MAKAILFDLDGTLTDSGEGIINCVSYTLAEFGLPVPDRQTLRVFVGPPLRDSFTKFGVPADRADEAVKVYRSRYIPVGIYENFPYPGIDGVLQALRDQGHRLFVATSKPEWMAVKVLEKFQLDHGLLRKNEFESVMKDYECLGLNVIGVNAREKFFRSKP